MSLPAVTHVVENLERGGLERTVIDLVRTQAAGGQRCQVVCLFERGALAGELDAIGVPVIACGKRRGLALRALARLRPPVRLVTSPVNCRGSSQATRVSPSRSSR